MRDLNSSLVGRCAEASLFQGTAQLAEKREAHATTRKLPIAPERFAPDLQATSAKIQLLYKYEDGCGRFCGRSESFPSMQNGALR
jgi:hypothetical protein